MLKFHKEYIKLQQAQLKERIQRAAEEEAEEEAARVAKQEEIAERERLLLEHKEDERLRQKYNQRKEKLAEQKWNSQLDTLLAQLKEDAQRDDKLEEIKIIIQNREPSLQELDWDIWLSDPFNQRLADLDFDHAVEMFKRDNLMAKRRKKTRGRVKKNLANYALSFTGENAADAKEDHVTTNFDPDAYELWKGFTVSYWVRPDEETGTAVAFGRRNGSSNERFFFGIHNARTYIGVGGGLLNDPDAKHGMTIGEWNHFVVTYDGDRTAGGTDTRLVYLNGELHYPTGAPGNVRWNNHRGDYGGGGHNIYFGGRNNNGNYTKGWACALDEVAIYDTAKDSDWVASVYGGGTVYDHKKTGGNGLVGYWKFNEGRGPTVKDHSGKGNHGTFAAISGDTTAFPTWRRR